MLRKMPRIPMVTALILALVLPAAADRTSLKPGFNIFSADQDVEMGRQVAAEADRELPIMNNRRVTDYVNTLGQRLAARAPGNSYPYQFKVVNDKAINAFALPGGFVYINRGTIEAADNEAQLAGVIAHEIAHVSLRHGTNQASKQYIAQVPLAILGGALGGGNSVGSVVAQLGIGFAANSILLKYSRDAERQADLLGAQILYDAGYDPNAMVQFFEKLQAESKGRPVEFFSSHPNPENRVLNVQREVEGLGGVRSGRRNDSQEFHSVKNLIASASAPRVAARAADRGDSNGRLSMPSDRMVAYRGGDFEIRHPENWRVYGQGDAITIAPDGGIVSGALAYGMMAAMFEPHFDDWNGRMTLEQATDQLLDEMRRDNPQMRISRRHERTRVNGENALTTELSNVSPVGGREIDQLVTVLRPDGSLYYFVGVAPANDYRTYDRVFDNMMRTVRFSR